MLHTNLIGEAVIFNCSIAIEDLAEGATFAEIVGVSEDGSIYIACNGGRILKVNDWSKLRLKKMTEL